MYGGYKIGHADGSRWKMEIFFLGKILNVWERIRFD